MRIHGLCTNKHRLLLLCCLSSIVRTSYISAHIAKESRFHNISNKNSYPPVRTLPKSLASTTSDVYWYTSTTSSLCCISHTISLAVLSFQRHIPHSPNSLFIVYYLHINVGASLVRLKAQCFHFIKS